MTATVKEFCRANGLDEKTENLVELIYEALTGGVADRNAERVNDTREKGKAPISNGSA